MAKDAPAPAGLTAEDVPVVLYLQQALDQAVALRASDLHFEPFEQHYRVRLRVDGQLREIAPPPFA
ncbi:MAG: type IV-A pilus assembly ATPase PilB, partial [Burkholderiaceae bacterium]|nr:type IV-A pilus assembly ATPase PilB [Burkholderiaceae bacterium]